jgi:hypothetical protein
LGGAATLNWGSGLAWLGAFRFQSWACCGGGGSETAPGGALCFPFGSTAAFSATPVLGVPLVPPPAHRPDHDRVPSPTALVISGGGPGAIWPAPYHILLFTIMFALLTIAPLIICPPPLLVIIPCHSPRCALVLLTSRLGSPERRPCLVISHYYQFHFIIIHTD